MTLLTPELRLALRTNDLAAVPPRVLVRPDRTPFRMYAELSDGYAA
ncbi:hypothetical protein [Sphingomonas sp. T9W2]